MPVAVAKEAAKSLLANKLAAVKAVVKFFEAEEMAKPVTSASVSLKELFLT